MDEQMIELIAKALHQSEAELFGYVRRPFELEGLWRNNERRYLREARAAHSVMAGKLAELTGMMVDVRNELYLNHAELAKPLIDKIDAALAHPKGME